MEFEDTLKEIQDKFRLLQSNAYKKAYLELPEDLKNTLLNYLKEHSRYDEYSEGKQHELLKDFLKGRCKVCTCGNLIRSKAKHCSSKCSNSSAEVMMKKENTVMKHYGVKSALQSEEVQDKRKKTCMERYGVDHISKVKEIQEKRENTMNERFGAKTNLMNEECKKKIAETNLQKYGFIRPSENEEIKAKIIKTNLERYGAGSFTASEKGKETVRNIVLEKYGVENVGQVKEIAEKRAETLRRKLYKHFDDFNKEFIDAHFFYDGVYHSDEIQEYFGLPQSTCSKNMIKLYGDYPCSVQRSKGEKSICEYLDSLGVKYEISDRNILKPQELDIVIPSIKLAIEYDGYYWHSDKFKDKNYHLEKTEKCSEEGYQLFHIFEFDDLDIWKSMIANKLKMNEKIYARKCVVKDVSYADMVKFLDENHLQGSCPSKINLGLYYNDELVEIMTFGKPRFSKDAEYELLRLCTKKFKCVIGGSSKLFKAFRDRYSGSVLSYANRRFSSGGIYESLGFTCCGSTNPNYFYVKCGVSLSRYQCQKHKLKNILEKFDPQLTEVQNMENNGYDRIFDCGNMKYIMK